MDIANPPEGAHRQGLHWGKSMLRLSFAIALAAMTLTSAAAAQPQRLAFPGAPLPYTRIADLRVAEATCTSGASRACQPQYDRCIQEGTNAHDCAVAREACLQRFLNHCR